MSEAFRKLLVQERYNALLLDDLNPEQASRKQDGHYLVSLLNDSLIDVELCQSLGVSFLGRLALVREARFMQLLADCVKLVLQLLDFFDWEL